MSTVHASSRSTLGPGISTSHDCARLVTNRTGNSYHKSTLALRPAVVLLFALVVLTLPARESHGTTYVVFTIDACWTCGNSFQGNCKGRDLGVPLIAEKLEAGGFKGTFFVSPYCPDSMQKEMFDNLRYLVARGHDVELHTHTEVFDLSRNRLYMYPKEFKRRIISEGIRNIVASGAPPPIAHRAGGYGIDQETLELLPEFGIEVDSSIFPVSPDSLVPLPRDLANRFVKIRGVYQLPITLLTRLPYIGYAGTTSLDIDRTIWEEQKAALEQLAEHRVPVVTVFLHASSTYRKISATVPYESDAILGPDEENIRELDNLIRLFRTDSRFKVVTAREVWEIFRKDPRALDGPAFIPYGGIHLLFLKAWRHFFGHGVKNKLVILSPVNSTLREGLPILYRFTN